MRKAKDRSHKEAVKGGQRRKRKSKKALVIARQKGLKILPNVPDNRQDFIDQIFRHHYLKTSLVTYFRHNCTNYDQVLAEITKRLGDGVDGRLASQELKKESLLMLWGYLKSIDADFLGTYPDLLTTKRDLRNDFLTNNRTSSHPQRSNQSRSISPDGIGKDERRVDGESVGT